MRKEPHRWDLKPCTVLSPELSILLGKALKGGRDTQRSVGDTALSPRSLPSGTGRDGQGRAEQLDLVFVVVGFFKTQRGGTKQRRQEASRQTSWRRKRSWFCLCGESSTGEGH